MLAAAPDWAAITTAVATAVTAIVLGGTAILARRTLRDAQNTRHANVLTELSRRWDDPHIVQSVKLFARYKRADLVSLIETIYDERKPSDQELFDFATLEAIPNLWETVAILQSEGAFPLSMVEKMWGAAIASAWDAWEAAIKRLRELTDTPTTYCHFERLATALRNQEESRLGARRVWPLFGARIGRPRE
jgi:hypothetical protein